MTHALMRLCCCCCCLLRHLLLLLLLRRAMESTGAGEPVYEALLHAGIGARPYPFTAKSKSALIDNLAMLLEEGELELPAPALWPEGIDELEAFEYSVTEAGNVKMSAPGGQHDDCVAALALAVWPLRSTRMVCQIG